MLVTLTSHIVTAAITTIDLLAKPASTAVEGLKAIAFGAQVAEWS